MARRTYRQGSHDILRDYNEGRLSVNDFLNVCRSYPGPAPHYLLSDVNDDQRVYLYDFPADQIITIYLRSTPEDKLVVLLEAVLQESPDLLSFPHHSGGLLHLALEHTRSARIHLLLLTNVPEGCTRLLTGDGRTPLHVACRVTGFFGGAYHPSVVNRLIDLDPGALEIRDRNSNVPLHLALGCDPTRPYLQRMIQLRPETVLLRNNHGRTPVALALEHLSFHESPTWAAADALRILIESFPTTVAPCFTTAAEDEDDDGDASTIVGSNWSEASAPTPLLLACGCRHNFPDLVRSIMRAHPMSLIIGCRVDYDDEYTYMPGVDDRDEDDILLPVEVATTPYRLGGVEALAFVREESVHVILAVVEYVLGTGPTETASPSPPPSRTDHVVERLREHFKDTLRERVPVVPITGETGLSVAQALHEWIRANNNTNGAVLTLVRALLGHDNNHRTADMQLSRDDAHLLRNAVLYRETVVDLYRMNCRGRYRPNNNVAVAMHHPHRREQGGGSGSVTAKAAATAAEQLHQIVLLASLRDSRTIESTYLQFRYVAHYPLLVQKRQVGGALNDLT